MALNKIEKFLIRSDYGNIRIFDFPDLDLFDKLCDFVENKIPGVDEGIGVYPIKFLNKDNFNHFNPEFDEGKTFYELEGVSLIFTNLEIPFKIEKRIVFSNPNYGSIRIPEFKNYSGYIDFFKPKG